MKMSDPVERVRIETLEAAGTALVIELSAARARIAALETERNNELEGNARFRVEHEQLVRSLRKRIEALKAMLQKVVIQERRVAASIDMTRSAMREGAAELANEIDAALKGGRDE